MLPAIRRGEKRRTDIVTREGEGGVCHTRTEEDEDGRDAGKGQQHTRLLPPGGRVVVGERSNERVACLSSSDTGTCVHVVSCCVCIASRLRLVTRGVVGG